MISEQTDKHKDEIIVREQDINPKNTNLKKQYLEYLNCRYATTAETKQATQCLDMLFAYLYYKADNKRMVEMTPSDYLGFFSWAVSSMKCSKELYDAARTVFIAVIRFVKRFFAEQYGDLVNYALRISPPYIPPKQRWKSPMLSKHQCLEVLDKLCEIGQYKKACFYALAMSTGLPMTSLMLFKIENIDEDFLLNGTIYRTPSPIYMGENTFQTVYILEDPFIKYFKMWMGTRLKRGIKSQWLFPTRNDERKHITSQNVSYWNSELRKQSGYTQINNDSFSRFYCTRLIELGFTLKTVKPLFKGSRSKLLSLFEDTFNAYEADASIQETVLEPTTIKYEGGEF